MPKSREEGVTLSLASNGGEVEWFARDLLQVSTGDALKILNDEYLEIRDRYPGEFTLMANAHALEEDCRPIVEEMPRSPSALRRRSRESTCRRPWFLWSSPRRTKTPAGSAASSLAHCEPCGTEPCRPDRDRHRPADLAYRCPCPFAGRSIHSGYSRRRVTRCHSTQYHSSIASSTASSKRSAFS
jgi:hypothetical protein